MGVPMKSKAGSLSRPGSNLQSRCKTMIHSSIRLPNCQCCWAVIGQKTNTTWAKNHIKHIFLKHRSKHKLQNDFASAMLMSPHQCTGLHKSICSNLWAHKPAALAASCTVQLPVTSSNLCYISGMSSLISVAFSSIASEKCLPSSLRRPWS